MIDSFLYAMVILFFVRLFGIILQLDYAIKTHRNNTIYLLFAWIIYTLAPIFAILSVLNELSSLSEIFFCIYVFTATIAIFLLAVGATMFFFDIPNYMIQVVIITITFVSFVGYLIWGSTLTNFISIFLQTVILFAIIIIGLLKFSVIREFTGTSVYWMLFIFGTGTIHAFSYLFFYTEEMIPYSYIMTIILSVLVLIFYTHVEQNISKFEKDLIKDKYSHNIANIQQAVLGRTDLLLLSGINLEKNREHLIEMKRLIEETSRIIKEIRKL